MRRIPSTTVDKRKHFAVDIKDHNIAPLLCIVGFSGAGKTTVTESDNNSEENESQQITR